MYIDTIDHGKVKIVSVASEKYYLKVIDEIEDTDGNYWKIWLHYQGYKGAIKN